MVTTPKLTIETLTKLGARKLAEVLLAEVTGNRQLRQTLKLLISAKDGPEALATSLRKRLFALANAHAMLSYEKGRELVAELDRLRSTIVGTIGPKEPGLALDLLWQFLDLHASIFERVDDSSGRLGDLFRNACDDLGPLAESAEMDPGALADIVFEKITNNGYGIYDCSITALAGVLGRPGRAKLRVLLLERREEHVTNEIRAAIAAGRYDHTLGGLSLALRDLADCDGDTDAFIETYQGRDLKNPRFASEIALRLLQAGRAEEAMNYLDQAEPCAANGHFAEAEWTDARIGALDTLQRIDEAQGLRMAVFEKRLSPTHLRAYLKRLPDFDDVEAEREALDLAVAHGDVHIALAFLLEWPALERAAKLIQLRIKEIDGDCYELLDPAARGLESKYPLAAVLLRRALIEVSLQKARSTRYKHAARHVNEIASVKGQIGDYASFETHDQFMARLKSSHARKSGFWSLLRE